ncbi:hypothetical protein [Cupriavidus basilensis]|uniref:hypothetical protein n=1 Tax=Cupriavidus basilensis TaxID=68895 RepID=UPI0020A693C2|nr:hypothetical protein [Cupriavidus basilensis]MCP3017950.1 hypothetical protein [Cupriavidus basilensis]
MTYSSLSDAVTGFKSDADRVDTFGNGDANATYTSKTGAIVPSIQNLIGQWNYSINVAANGILAQSTAQANAAAASASASAGSASASAGSATSAAASQGAAAGSAASAAASAAGALSSQNAAATSEANAASSATNVSALLASFRGAFLGAFASDSAAVAFAAANSITLVSGVMYENTTGNKFRIYNGSAWGDYDASAQASQSAASLSAANAAGSAAAAANSQSNAAMSELSSAGSASSAATSAAGALASLTDFKGRWFGGLASDPALDLNGNPLAAGDAYFNTTLNQTRTYTGSAWQAPFSPTDSGTVSFQQAATGAALRWLQTKARERVSVDDFTGVDPTGATDSYAGFVNANAYCTATGKELFGQGTYLLNSMPVLSCDCDFWTATFNIPGTRAIGVELSTGSSTNPTDNLICKRIRLGNIVNTTKPSTGWAGQGIGVRAVNLLTCDVLIKRIKDFGVGLRETAYQTGCAYNEIKVLYYENSKVNLQIQPGDAVGYTNESNHYGGRYHFRDTEGVNVAGTRHIQILPFDVTNATASWPNNHSFHKPSLEGNVPEYHVEIGGGSNTFAYGRWEATAPKVLLTGHASNVSKTSKNIFVGGYQTDLVVFTTTGVSTGGDIIHPRKWVHNGFGAGAVFRNTGGDVQNTPLLRGYASDQVIANAAGTDANWSWNLYTAALQGKNTADAYERVRLEFSTGRLYLGSGGGAHPPSTLGVAGHSSTSR